MGPGSQGLQWTDVLCCGICGNVFGNAFEPVNLACGHTSCRNCLLNVRTSHCPFDQTSITIPVGLLPANSAFLKILGCATNAEVPNLRKLFDNEDDFAAYKEAIKELDEMAKYFRRAHSERGGSVWSAEVGRGLQRKLVGLLCCQLLEEEGRARAVKAARSLAERALTELLLLHQNSSHLSSNLWSAVRARGCQFLGPAMQEEVLRLILLTFAEGVLISRKTLVMYIVQTLDAQYPHASKTSVGHVVQLLYRASCFNVVKREGESSLMQLKEEFRTYEALRREHDAQIVHIAMESGLRISPDQWSALLYGDQHHRSHIQSIIDKLQSPQSFGQNIQELSVALQRVGDPENLSEFIPYFELLASLDPLQSEGAGDSIGWTLLRTVINAARRVLDGQIRYCHKYGGRSQVTRPSYRSQQPTGSERHASGNSAHNAEAAAAVNCPSSRPTATNGDVPLGRRSPPPFRPCAAPPMARCTLASGFYGDESRTGHAKYRTSMCRDVAAGRRCPRGADCSFAHSLPEMNARRAARAPYAPPFLPHQHPPNAVPPQFLLQNEAGGSAFPDHLQNLNYADMPNGVAPPHQLMPMVPIGMPPPPPQPPILVQNVPPPPQLIQSPAQPQRTAFVQTPQQTLMTPQQTAAYPPTARFLLVTPDSPFLPINQATIVKVAAETPLFTTHTAPVVPVPVPSPVVVPVTPIPQEVDGKRMQLTQLQNKRQEIMERLSGVRGLDSWDDDLSLSVAASVLSDVESTEELQLAEKSRDYRDYAKQESTYEEWPALDAGAHQSDDNLPGTWMSIASSLTSLWYSEVTDASGTWRGAPPTTVNADTSVMKVKDALPQPVPSPFFQPHLPLTCVETMPVVVQRRGATVQDAVGASIDRIVEVKECLGAMQPTSPLASEIALLGSSVQKEQLRWELHIVNQRIEAMDKETEAACLLNELQNVDHNIAELKLT